jgi:hypothetical protein
MEYVPSLDSFKHALAPIEIKERWNELESYVYVISKRVILDEMANDSPPIQIFKIGVSTMSGNIQRMISMRTFLVSFKVHRLYLFERFQLPGQKKGADSSTYAYLAEQQLHASIEAKYAPEKVRVSFPGSVEGFDSQSEWFIVPTKREKAFLNFLDQTVYKDVGVPPIYGSKFVENMRTRINIKPNARGVGFEKIGTTTAKKKKTFRKSESVLARSDRSHRAAGVMALRARQQKKNKAQERARLKKTKPFWEKVFVGKTFKDPDLGAGTLKFTELRQIRDLADFATQPQLVVLYESAGRRTRSSSNETSEGYLTINESLDALGPAVIEKHKDSHAWYRRLNGYDESVVYGGGGPMSVRIINKRRATGDSRHGWAWDFVVDNAPPICIIYQNVHVTIESSDGDSDDYSFVEAWVHDRRRRTTDSFLVPLDWRQGLDGHMEVITEIWAEPGLAVDPTLWKGEGDDYWGNLHGTFELRRPGEAIITKRHEYITWANNGVGRAMKHYSKGKDLTLSAPPQHQHDGDDMWQVLDA